MRIKSIVGLRSLLWLSVLLNGACNATVQEASELDGVGSAQGAQIDDSCTAGFKEHEVDFADVVQEGLADGGQCLSNINSPLADSFQTLQQEQTVALTCDTERVAQWDAFGLAFQAPHEVVLPELSDVLSGYGNPGPGGPEVSLEGAIKTYQTTLFHEYVHLLGYVHSGETIDYADACEACCEEATSVFVRNLACEICGSSWTNVDDWEYVSRMARIYDESSASQLSWSYLIRYADKHRNQPDSQKKALLLLLDFALKAVQPASIGIPLYEILLARYPDDSEQVRQLDNFEFATSDAYEFERYEVPATALWSALFAYFDQDFQTAREELARAHNWQPAAGDVLGQLVNAWYLRPTLMTINQLLIQTTH